MEKRHYRNGYYVQRASFIVNNHESPQPTTTFPSNFALTDTSESVAYEDAHLTDASVRAVEKSTTDSSVTTSQRHTSPCESRHVSEKNIKPIQLEQPYSQPNLDDEQGEKKTKQKSGKRLILAGIILMVLSLGILFPLLLLGLILFIVGVQKWITIRRDKGLLINTKPLWISVLILMGIFVVFIVLGAYVFESLLIGSLISLPIALILAIIASRIERGNRKALQSQSSNQPPKERFRKLKKFFLWFAIILAAILVALIIGLILGI